MITKTIYVATDYSEKSYGASIYGIALAKAFDAKLILFSAYRSAPAMEGPAISSSEYIHSAADKKPGFTTNPTQRFITPDTEAAIAGMKEKEKDIHRILGNVVIASGKRAAFSLLLVPGEANYINNDLVKMSGETDVAADISNDVLDTIRKIGEKFDSRIYLVH